MDTYITGSNKEISRENMLKTVKDKVRNEKLIGHTIVLLIGCDSQVVVTDETESVVFATAIAIHVKGHGGIFFIRKKKEDKRMHLSTRLFEEVTMAIDEAELLKEHNILDTVDKVEIHVDAGKNGSSRDYASALKGMIEGFGYKGYIKPESMAASVIADKYTK